MKFGRRDKEITSQPEVHESTAELLIKDPEVQAGLRGVFDELDNFTASVEQHGYAVGNAISSRVAADGSFIEGYFVKPQKAEDDEQPTGSSDYFIFCFNMSDVKDPDFTLKPYTFSSDDSEHVKRYRGSGMYMFLSSGNDDPVVRVHFPLHHPAMTAPIKPITIDGKDTEPFRDMRERAGVDL